MTYFLLRLFTLRRTVISPKPSVGWMFCWTRKAFMWDLSIEKTLLASQLLLMNYVHALTGKQIAFKYRNEFEKFILQEMLNIWAPAKCRSTELQKFATDVASAVTMEKHLSDHMITKHEATIIEQKNSSVLHSKASILLYKHRLFKSDWGCWIIENGRCWYLNARLPPLGQPRLHTTIADYFNASSSNCKYIRRWQMQNGCCETKETVNFGHQPNA